MRKSIIAFKFLHAIELFYISSLRDLGILALLGVTDMSSLTGLGFDV